MEVHLPDRVMRQFGLQQALHINSMVDKAKSLGDTPLYEDLYMFRKMVQNQCSDCLRYVHKADMIHVSANYRRDEIQPDQLRPPIHSYRPQHFENAPNFTSSPVPMSIDIPDATNNLENLNTEMEDNELDDTNNNLKNFKTEMEDNELDDSNNEVNRNDSEDASKGSDTTIQHDELSKKQKRTIILCNIISDKSIEWQIIFVDWVPN
ncbi:putative heme-binding protein 2-like [Capsicum annuum]|uniref:Uncharacterized protein n=1 Tax=Capsicum annuum TaxID=4072 RepID=A0A2G2YJS7_CAPAN|nr:putative heme-binding protein 2-like [Capsicum annuum]KAF3644529.1 putative heme-binding protein 2-like [Capsicum annuum]PHT69990.1 hypothetical protein T459_25094 [Capsicum annuum]